MSNEQVKCFISYAHEDKAKMGELLNALQTYTSLAIKCDEYIQGGAKLDTIIQELIIDSHIFIHLLSQSSRKSRWCKKEIEWATTYRKPIIQVCIDANIKRYTGELAKNKIIDGKDKTNQEIADCIIDAIMWHIHNKTEAKANISEEKRQMGRSFIIDTLEEKKGD